MMAKTSLMANKQTFSPRSLSTSLLLIIIYYMYRHSRDTGCVFSHIGNPFDPLFHLIGHLIPSHPVPPLRSLVCVAMFVPL